MVIVVVGTESVIGEEAGAAEALVLVMVGVELVVLVEVVVGAVGGGALVRVVVIGTLVSAARCPRRPTVFARMWSK
jgi:hypothetical protein